MKALIIFKGALRLGVCDYISKLQLDQEDCAEIFRRIASQMDSRTTAESSPRESKKSLLMVL